MYSTTQKSDAPAKVTITPTAIDGYLSKALPCPDGASYSPAMRKAATSAIINIASRSYPVKTGVALAQPGTTFYSDGKWVMGLSTSETPSILSVASLNEWWGQPVQCIKLAKASLGWAYVRLPEKIRNAMKKVRDKIDPADVEEKEGHPHITAKYGLKTTDPDEVRQILAGNRGGKVKFGKTSIFEKDDCDVLKVSVTSHALHAVWKSLSKLDNEDQFKEYVPHATLAYLKKGTGKKYKNLETLEGMEFTFDEVVFEDKKDNATDIKLDGKVVKTAQTIYEKSPTDQEPIELESKCKDNHGNFFVGRVEWKKTSSPDGQSVLYQPVLSVQEESGRTYGRWTWPLETIKDMSGIYLDFGQGWHITGLWEMMNEVKVKLLQRKSMEKKLKEEENNPPIFDFSTDEDQYVLPDPPSDDLLASSSKTVKTAAAAITSPTAQAPIMLESKCKDNHGNTFVGTVEWQKFSAPNGQTVFYYPALTVQEESGRTHGRWTWQLETLAGYDGIYLDHGQGWTITGLGHMVDEAHRKIREWKVAEEKNESEKARASAPAVFDFSEDEELYVVPDFGSDDVIASSSKTVKTAQIGEDDIPILDYHEEQENLFDEEPEKHPAATTPLENNEMFRVEYQGGMGWQNMGDLGPRRTEEDARWSLTAYLRQHAELSPVQFRIVSTTRGPLTYTVEELTSMPGEPDEWSRITTIPRQHSVAEAVERASNMLDADEQYRIVDGNTGTVVLQNRATGNRNMAQNVPFRATPDNVAQMRVGSPYAWAYSENVRPAYPEVTQGIYRGVSPGATPTRFLLSFEDRGFGVRQIRSTHIRRIWSIENGQTTNTPRRRIPQLVQGAHYTFRYMPDHIPEPLARTQGYYRGEAISTDENGDPVNELLFEDALGEIYRVRENEIVSIEAGFPRTQQSNAPIKTAQIGDSDEEFEINLRNDIESDSSFEIHEDVPASTPASETKDIRSMIPGNSYVIKFINDLYPTEVGTFVEFSPSSDHPRFENAAGDGVSYNPSIIESITPATEAAPGEVISVMHREGENFGRQLWSRRTVGEFTNRSGPLVMISNIVSDSGNAETFFDYSVISSTVGSFELYMVQKKLDGQWVHPRYGTAVFDNEAEAMTLARSLADQITRVVGNQTDNPVNFNGRYVVEQRTARGWHAVSGPQRFAFDDKDDATRLALSILNVRPSLMSYDLRIRDSETGNFLDVTRSQRFMVQEQRGGVWNTLGSSDSRSGAASEIQRLENDTPVEQQPEAWRIIDRLISPDPDATRASSKSVVKTAQIGDEDEFTIDLMNEVERETAEEAAAAEAEAKREKFHLQYRTGYGWTDDANATVFFSEESAIAAIGEQITKHRNTVQGVEDPGRFRVVSNHRGPLPNIPIYRIQYKTRTKWINCGDQNVTLGSRMGELFNDRSQAEDVLSQHHASHPTKSIDNFRVIDAANSFQNYPTINESNPAEKFYAQLGDIGKGLWDFVNQRGTDNPQEYPSRGAAYNTARRLVNPSDPNHQAFRIVSNKHGVADLPSSTPSVVQVRSTSGARLQSNPSSLVLNAMYEIFTDNPRAFHSRAIYVGATNFDLADPAASIHAAVEFQSAGGQLFRLDWRDLAALHQITDPNNDDDDAPTVEITDTGDNVLTSNTPEDLEIGAAYEITREGGPTEPLIATLVSIERLDQNGIVRPPANVELAFSTGGRNFNIPWIALARLRQVTNPNAGQPNARQPNARYFVEEQDDEGDWSMMFDEGGESVSFDNRQDADNYIDQHIFDAETAGLMGGRSRNSFRVNYGTLEDDFPITRWSDLQEGANYDIELPRGTSGYDLPMDSDHHARAMLVRVNVSDTSNPIAIFRNRLSGTERNVDWNAIVSIRPAQLIRVEECGQCGGYHREGYGGDCRNNQERFADMEDAERRLGMPVEETFSVGVNGNQEETPTTFGYVAPYTPQVYERLPNETIPTWNGIQNERQRILSYGNPDFAWEAAREYAQDHNFSMASGRVRVVDSQGSALAIPERFSQGAEVNSANQFVEGRRYTWTLSNQENSAVSQPLQGSFVSSRSASQSGTTIVILRFEHEGVLFDMSWPRMRNVREVANQTPTTDSFVVEFRIPSGRSWNRLTVGPLATEFTSFEQANQAVNDNLNASGSTSHQRYRIVSTNTGLSRPIIPISPNFAEEIFEQFESSSSGSDAIRTALELAGNENADANFIAQTVMVTARSWFMAQQLIRSQSVPNAESLARVLWNGIAEDFLGLLLSRIRSFAS